LLPKVLDKSLGFLWNHFVDIAETDAEWNR
jgi:hypothetical protein